MHRHVVATARFLIVLAIWIHFIKHYAHNSFQEITTVASCTKRMMDEGLSYMRCSFSGSVKKDTKLLSLARLKRIPSYSLELQSYGAVAHEEHSFPPQMVPELLV